MWRSDENAPVALLLLLACETPGGHPVKDPEIGKIDADGDGLSAEEGDCDDANVAARPGIPEQCNGIDDDCDGAIDAGLTSIFYLDDDGDGFGRDDAPLEACEQPEGYVEEAGDCEDDEPVVFPGNPEVCDGEDNNCTRVIDEGVTLPFYPDADGDGYGDPALPAHACAAPEGHTAVADDCDDGRADVWPGAEEVCDNTDNDCDGENDEGVIPTWYADADGDGFGDPGRVAGTCAVPAGFVADATDCDDTRAEVWPGTSEICNDLDDTTMG